MKKKNNNGNDWKIESESLMRPILLYALRTVKTALTIVSHSLMC